MRPATLTGRPMKTLRKRRNSLTRGGTSDHDWDVISDRSLVNILLLICTELSGLATHKIGQLASWQPVKRRLLPT